MSNILSLEELKELLHTYHNTNVVDCNPIICHIHLIKLCETAIEYYRRWQNTELKLLENLNNT